MLLLSPDHDLFVPFLNDYLRQLARVVYVEDWVTEKHQQYLMCHVECGGNLLEIKNCL